MIDLFRVSVYCEKLSTNINELEIFCRRERKQNKGNYASNEGGWQSVDLFQEERLDVLKKVGLISTIEHHASLYAESIGISTNLKIDTLWININDYGNHNVSHMHPNCLISGVFYVKVPKDSGSLVFHNPGSDMMSYDWDLDAVKRWTPYTSRTMTFTCEEGSLVLFPSWLKHRVEASNNKHNSRISISFNLS